MDKKNVVCWLNIGFGWGNIAFKPDSSLVSVMDNRHQGNELLLTGTMNLNVVG